MKQVFYHTNNLLPDFDPIYVLMHILGIILNNSLCCLFQIEKQFLYAIIN